MENFYEPGKPFGARQAQLEVEQGAKIASVMP
jgi:hypothetical protein